METSQTSPTWVSPLESETPTDEGAEMDEDEGEDGDEVRFRFLVAGDAMLFC